jgi:hypothetical protein
MNFVNRNQLVREPIAAAFIPGSRMATSRRMTTRDVPLVDAHDAKVYSRTEHHCGGGATRRQLRHT